jgi:hypothetical protein
MDNLLTEDQTVAGTFFCFIIGNRCVRINGDDLPGRDGKSRKNFPLDFILRIFFITPVNLSAMSRMFVSLLV